MLTLPRDSGCDVIASLPGSAEDEGEEGEDQDDDDDEATAVWSAAIDAALPLIPELPFRAHFVRSWCQRAALPMSSQMPSRAAAYQGPMRAYSSGPAGDTR